jgi:hypothetical protein
MKDRGPNLEFIILMNKIINSIKENCLHNIKRTQRCKHDNGSEVSIAIQLLKFNDVNHSHLANDEIKHVISCNN